MVSGSTGTSIQDAPDGCLVCEVGVGVDLLKGHRVLKGFRKILGARSVARKRAGAELGALLYLCKSAGSL